MQKSWPVIVLFVIAGVLRLYNLGYSDYQGDEIKALYNPKEDASVRFFLEQRKGPMQFLVTASLKNLSNNYRNRWLVRLPFALAGLGSVIVFYYLSKSLFNEKIAFYSSIFFSTNGFLIAFSRIAQYQSLVIFFGLLAIYLTKKYADSLRLRYLIMASISLAVSILSHYDGVFFIPIIFGIFYPLWRTSIKPFVVSVLLFLILTSVFYIPFVLNIAQSTTDYWAGRITGDVSGKISNSRYLFSVYQPIYVLHVYTILGLVGFGLLFFITLYKIFPGLVSKVVKRAYKLDSFNAIHTKFKASTILAVLVWFLIPFVLLEKVIYIPGTHIYTYLIPVFLMMGFAVFHADLISRKILKGFSTAFVIGIWLLFIFLSLQSYYVFVDHKYEYPWENKKFLIWTFPKPTPIFHLSMFGFPYYRHWDEIGDFIKTDGKASFYTTNERVSISRYHIDLGKDGDKAGYYVYIMNPQTFTNEITNKRIEAWIKDNSPILEYENQGRVVSQIYLVNSLTQ